MDFTALLIFTILAFSMPAGMIAAQTMLGPRVITNVKQMPFECGLPPFGVAQGRMSVKFYQVAMLFIIFDLEIVFLWPWALALRSLVAANGAGSALLSMGVFLGLLTLSHVYAWRKGALEWES